MPTTDLRTSTLCLCCLRSQSVGRLPSPGLHAAPCSGAKLISFGCCALFYSSATFHGILEKLSTPGATQRSLPCPLGCVGRTAWGAVPSNKALQSSGLTTLLERTLSNYLVSLLSLLTTVQHEDAAEREGRPAVSRSPC